MFSINMQEHKPLRELVYEELRKLIMTGQIKPGTRMMEIDLAESMGVSRTPVREAIRQLEKDNLVTIEPRRGAYVSDISPEDIGDMLLVREQLEGLATCLAAENMSDEEIEELVRMKDAYEQAYEKGTMQDLIEIDTRFHSIISNSCGNEYLISVLQELQDQVLRFRYIYFKSIKRAAEVIEDHANILESIVSRDGNAAKKYAEDHVCKLRTSIRNDEDFERDAKN